MAQNGDQKNIVYLFGAGATYAVLHRAVRPGRGIPRPAGAGIHRAVRPAGLPAEKPGDAGRHRARGSRGVPESHRCR